MSQTIPRILHQVWLGTDPVPYADYRASWQKLHPDWEYHLWTDANLPPSPHQKLLDRCDTHAARSNIRRLELLVSLGGVYVDVDAVCVRAIDALIAPLTCALPRHAAGNRLTNFFMASVPQHPWMQHQLNQLGLYAPRHSPWSGQLMGDTITQFSDVTLLQSSLFPKKGAETDIAYVIHDAASSWAQPHHHHKKK